MKPPEPNPGGHSPQPSESQDRRISELEMRITFQEDQIEALHKTAYDQAKMLDKLFERVESLVTTQRLASGENHSGDEPPPPHY